MRIGRPGCPTAPSDIRFRPEFRGWSLQADLVFAPDLLEEQRLRELICLAGCHVGLGDWRPSRGGEFGRFRLSSFKVLEKAQAPEDSCRT